MRGIIRCITLPHTQGLLNPINNIVKVNKNKVGAP
jgi:hypothetical protein